MSIYDYWRERRFQPTAEYTASRRFSKAEVQAAYSILHRAYCYMTQSRSRGIIAAFLVSIGGFGTGWLYAGSQSTYICPIVLHGAAVFRGLAFLSTLLDSAILIGVAEFCRTDVEKVEARKKKVLVSLGAGLLVSPATLSRTRILLRIAVRWIYLGLHWALCPKQPI